MGFLGIPNAQGVGRQFGNTETNAGRELAAMQGITQPMVDEWGNAVGAVQGNAADYLAAAQKGTTVAQGQLARGVGGLQHAMTAQSAGHGAGMGRAAALGAGNAALSGMANSNALKAQETQNAYNLYNQANLNAANQYGGMAQFNQGQNQAAQQFGFNEAQLAAGQQAQTYGQATGGAAALAGASGAMLAQSDERMKHLWRTMGGR